MPLMGEKKHQKFLTVAPFECAWREELKFREAGRGCVSFEAFAHNDVTVVFREEVGSQHYHYKIDNSPNYTIIIGSHRNRRLKIEVNGKAVVDVAGAGLCSSSTFQSYWISIYDGLICIGKGRYPFQNLVFQWLDSEPNCNVQYVGLSSWDKHVGYKNVSVLPLKQQYNCLWKHADYKEYDGGEEDEEEWGDVGGDCHVTWGLRNFLESFELSDVIFLVEEEGKAVPAHMIILAAAGNFSFGSSAEHVIRIPSVSYPILLALLQYIYTGRTQIEEHQLSALRDLGLHFQVVPLVKQCEEIIDRFKTNKKLFDSGKNVELIYSNPGPHHSFVFPCELPLNVEKLKQMSMRGEYSDVNIFIDGCDLVARTHRLVLSLWSPPFMKMFTNGMSETNLMDIHLRDISSEAFLAMLQFMYSGEIETRYRDSAGPMLLELLLLADQFGVTFLHQECCNRLSECLVEDLLCPILQVISSIPSCKLLKEACERKFSLHFDYFTTSSTDFVFLDEAIITNILKHPALTVTSEERVLDAILLWCIEASDIHGWEVVDKYLESLKPEHLFGEKIKSLVMLLPLVRFPLMPTTLLEKLEKSNLSDHIPVFKQLVLEAVEYISSKAPRLGSDQNMRYRHRQSSFKELQYICDGDENGVLYYAGTSCGEHQWVNPVLAKKVAVTASSPTSRHTDPKALVSRTYVGTSYAGPRFENGQTCAWYMVDIGQDHQLMCNYYTLRQDGSTAYMRYWALQGSCDGENWTDLRVHDNDRTICKPAQFASWPINGPTALLPFRYFRVLLTSPTTSDSHPWNLCICYLELYGFFH